MWQKVKKYFEDGGRSSNPWRFRTHLCKMHSQPSPNDTIHHGLEINEEAMSIFTSLGDTSRAPCHCDDLDELTKYMDYFIQSAPTTPPEDYDLYTAKDEKSVHEATMYAFRDTLQFWAIWHGPLEPHYWKHMYIVFTSCCDDICIPPQDLESGKFQVLGHSLDDVLNGLLSENVDPDDVQELKMLLWRESIGQYLEKIHPEIRNQLVNKTTMMTPYRVRTANGEGAALVALAAQVTGSLKPYYDLVELAGIAVCLSMDIAKEGLGILRGEKTETVAGDDRELLKSEIRWLYTRTMESLDKQSNAQTLRWFATSGFILPYYMDRYRERVKHIRVPITTDLKHRIESYRNLKIGVSNINSYGHPAGH